MKLLDRKPKSYHRMYKENKRLLRDERKAAILFAVGVMLFYISVIALPVSRIGEYVLSKQNDSQVCGTEQPDWDCSFHTNASTVYFDQAIIIAPDILAQGVCVDKSQSIINILKRHYTGFNRIRVAISDNHAQVIRQDIDGTIEYLDLKGMKVLTSNSEFNMDIKAMIKPDDFIEAINYYKSGISIKQLNKYLDNKYLVTK